MLRVRPPITTRPNLPKTTFLQIAPWLLALTAAAAPAYVVRWHAGPIPTTLLENLIVLTVAVYVVARWRTGRRSLVGTPYDLPVVLLLGAGAAAVAVAADHRAALGVYRAYLIEPVAIFYVAADLLRDAQARQWTLLGLAAGGATLAILNLAAFAFAPGHPVGIGTVPVSVYNSPNFVAMFLEPLVAVSIGFLIFGQRRDRYIAGMFLLISLPTLLLTFSRGAYLALAALVVVALLSIRRKVQLLMAAAFLALSVLFWQLPETTGRVAQIFNSKDPANTSVIFRLALWRDTLQLLRAHPLLGTGLTAGYPHNLWLAFWSQLGLVGLVAFAFVFFALLWRGWRALLRGPQSQRPLLWGISTGFVMMAVHGLVDTPYWKNDLSLEFWLVAAMEVAVIAFIRDPTDVLPPLYARELEQGSELVSATTG